MWLYDEDADAGDEQAARDAWFHELLAAKAGPAGGYGAARQRFLATLMRSVIAYDCGDAVRTVLRLHERTLAGYRPPPAEWDDAWKSAMRISKAPGYASEREVTRAA